MGHQLPFEFAAGQRVIRLVRHVTRPAKPYFYSSNIRSLSATFESDLATPAGMKGREKHVIDVVMSYLGNFSP